MMRKIIKIASGTVATISGTIAIVLAVHWVGSQDVIMGHSGYQEPQSIIAATWSASLSLLATVCFGLASFTRAFGSAENAIDGRNPKSVPTGCLFWMLLFVTSGICVNGYFEVPLARQHLMLQRIRSGEVSDNELREATKSSSSSVRHYAMEELRKRGRVPPLWE